MPQTIRIRRTTSNNPPTGLLFGELAWSENGILYVGRANGTSAPLMVVTGITKTASEALFAGAFVNFWNNNGVESMRLADATLGRQAHGFVAQAIAAGATGLAVVGRGVLNNQAQTSGGTALVTGDYHLAVAGRISQNMVPEASGQFHQRVAIVSGSDLIVILQEGRIRG